MYNIDEIISKEYVDELQKVCRYQLTRYPNSPRVSLNAKKLLKKLLCRKNKTDRYFWPNGLLTIALEQTYKKRNNHEDLNSLIDYYDKWIESGVEINNLDNVINGYSMVFVYEKTEEEKYKKALDLMVEYIVNHPKDKHNSLPYRIKNSNPDKVGDIFVDSLGMICPFLCRYGDLINDKEMINLAIDQLKNFINYGLDNTKKLPYHAYNTETISKFGIVGWGRAVGWLLIGLIDSLEYIKITHKDYSFLRNNFIEIVNAVIKYQHKDGHYSWQLEALEGPIDTSSTSMISYAIGKAIKIEILEKSYEKYVEKSILALYTSTKNGYVENCSAECRGLSMYPQKYGWYPWSQGPTTALMSMFLEK